MEADMLGYISKKGDNDFVKSIFREKKRKKIIEDIFLTKENEYSITVLEYLELNKSEYYNIGDLGYWDLSHSNQEHNNETTGIISIKTNYGKILEINEDFMTVKVLMDEENRIFQIRKFDMEPFRGNDFSVNDIMEIKVTTKNKERKFEYSIDNNQNTRTLFEKKDYFSELADSELFNPPTKK